MNMSTPQKKIILDLCGGTGSWSTFYRQDPDYHVIVVDPAADDLDDAEVVRADVRTWIPPFEAYGVLAAPPCTHLAGSGARWWAEKGEEALIEAMSVVDACMRIVYTTKPEFWALENPVGRLTRYLGEPQLRFNPYDYGDPRMKRTLLWGDFNSPPKTPVEPTEGQWQWMLWPSPERARLRSMTPQGFAKAFYESNK